MVRLPTIVFGLLALLAWFGFTGSERKAPVARLDQAAWRARFTAATDGLVADAEALSRGNDSVAVRNLREGLAVVRSLYKEREFLLAYYYPGFVEEHLNGAPLLHAERDEGHGNVVPPEGLQVLDELAYGELDDQTAVEISLLARDFGTRSQEVGRDFAVLEITLDHYLNACRAQVIRCLTMGITGFDTPGSATGVDETRVSLRSMAAGLARQPAVAGHREYGELNAVFDRAERHLTGRPSFEDFDRLGFIREVLNPLYALLGSMQMELGLAVPSLFPSPVNSAATNPFARDFLDPYFFTDLSAAEDSPALRTLGEALFYDVRLSASATLSCASCHDPAQAFTDGRPKSLSAVDGRTVARNAPTLLNAVYADRYFYDLRAFTLEQQAEHVIFDGQEFNTTYAALLERVNAATEYRALTRVLGKDKGAGKGWITDGDRLTREGFSAALASYVLSLRSWDSPFDRYVRGEVDSLPAGAGRGFNLFMGKAACGTCHFAPTFSGLVPPTYGKNESEILGVLTTPHAIGKQLDADPGRAANGLRDEAVRIYEKSFKTPTVRGVAATAPYFHNGAYATLEMVINFYDRGGGAGHGLDVYNQTLSANPLDLSVEEKADLVAFMESLSTATE